MAATTTAFCASTGSTTAARQHDSYPESKLFSYYSLLSPLTLSLLSTHSLVSPYFLPLSRVSNLIPFSVFVSHYLAADELLSQSRSGTCYGTPLPLRILKLMKASAFHALQLLAVLATLFHSACLHPLYITCAQFLPHWLDMLEHHRLGREGRRGHCVPPSRGRGAKICRLKNLLTGSMDLPLPPTPRTMCRLEQRLRGISRWGADGDEGIVQCVEFFQDRGDTVVLVSGALTSTTSLLDGSEALPHVHRRSCTGIPSRHITPCS